MGFLFFVILTVLFLSELIAIYSKKYFLCYLFVGVAAAILYKVFNLNVSLEHLWYVLYYAICGLIWMPIFWYLSMLKTSKEVSTEILKYGSMEKCYQNTYSREIKRNIDYDPTKNTYKVDIIGPERTDVVNNSIFFPVSIVAFFGENLFTMTYNSLALMMESIRKSFSDSINNRFKV